MTNTEAKAIIKDNAVQVFPSQVSYRDWLTAIHMAEEALENRTPKTLYKHLNTRYTHFGSVRHDKFMCCNCGIRMEFIDGHTAQYKYCPWCGSEIDWSYEE